MNNKESIKKFIPIVHLFPLTTFKIRLKEKLYHFRRQHSFLASKEISTDKDGNVLLKFRANCEAVKKGGLLKAPRDKMIFEYIKNLGCWAKDESDFLVEQLNKEEKHTDLKCVVVDMGANIGLISLQIARKASFVPDFIFVEPIPRHINALKFNISGNSKIKNFKICEYALAKNAAKGLININLQNLGGSYVSNNSQNLGDDFTSESIEILGIDDFALDYLSGYERIFLKSDLEGFDLEVLGNLSSDYWEKVIAGVVEVMPNKSGDVNALDNVLNQLNSFPTLTWDPHIRIKISALEISNFWLHGRSDLTRNLFFTKA
jgi:FkbM family methyltransferase